MFNAPYIRVLSKPSASAGGRSSCFGITWTAAERAVTNSVARICIVRDGSIAIPLLLTPGLGRVVTTAAIFVLKFPPDRNCPGHWSYLECAIDWSCVCSPFPSSHPRAVQFTILIGPDSKNTFFEYSYKDRVERIVDICVKKDPRTKHTS